MNMFFQNNETSIRIYIIQYSVQDSSQKEYATESCKSDITEALWGQKKLFRKIGGIITRILKAVSRKQIEISLWYFFYFI